ncbi:hypothetical protein [Salipiger abyssi]|uniref:hypothetical protein n=1 Tax=Salipiger abyssi TaxID=1250539 RepID=UPI004058ACFC
MGFTPAQVDRMGMWEFLACLDGYAGAHGGKKPPGGGGEEMSEDRMRDLGIEGL